jgi:hypothetical protein
VGGGVRQTQQNVYIKHCIEIEQFLMEGAYNKVIQARQSIPAEPYAYFMELLMHTVRCAPAYTCGAWAPTRKWIIINAAQAPHVYAGCRYPPNTQPNPNPLV